jgi:flagellar motor protein MotB
MTDIPMPSAPPPLAGLTPYVLIVAFDTGSSTLSAQAEDVMQIAARQPARGHTTLIGHTDEAGTRPDDLMLALARVHAVRNRLLRLHPELETSLHTEAEYDCGHVAMAGTRSHRALGGSVLIVFEPAAPP